MASFAAVLIDLDGTLVDSEPLKGAALAAAAAAHGKGAAVALYQEVMGSDWTTVRARFMAAADVTATAAEFDATFRVDYRRRLRDGVREQPGAAAFLATLRARGCKTALVSSAARWMIDEILQAKGFAGLFDAVVGQEDVARHKPDPEAFALALARLGLPAGSAWVFEDSEAGVQAGRAAGCTVVAMRHEFNRSHDLSGAIAVISSFDEIEAIMERYDRR